MVRILILSSLVIGGCGGSKFDAPWDEANALPDAVDAPADCISEEQEVPAPPRREARLVLLKPPEIDLSQCAVAAESSVPSEHSSNNASSVSTATATSRARPSFFVRCCRSALCVLGTVLLALLAFATTADERATRAGANPLSTAAPTSTPLPSAQPLSERLLTMKLSVAAALGVGILTLGVAIGKRMR